MSAKSQLARGWSCIFDWIHILSLSCYNIHPVGWLKVKLDQDKTWQNLNGWFSISWSDIILFTNTCHTRGKYFPNFANSSKSATWFYILLTFSQLRLSTVKLNKRRLESNAMLYSPVHIKLSIAHFDFISDYTMMLDRCQREWHNPQSSHNTQAGQYEYWSLYYKGESFLLSPFIQGTKTNFVHDLFTKVFPTAAPRRLGNGYNPCLDWNTFEKIFLRTKTIFIIPDLAHLNQRFSSWHGSPLQLCQLGMVIVDHNGESSSSWDVWLWLTVCINGGNEMATKDPNTRITLNSLQPNSLNNSTQKKNIIWPFFKLWKVFQNLLTNIQLTEREWRNHW